MGILFCCTGADKEGDDPPESKTPILSHSEAPRRLYKLKMPQINKPGTRTQLSWRTAISETQDFVDLAAYEKARGSLHDAERARAFDAEVEATASSIERQASEIVRKIRLYDWDNTYGQPFDANGLTGKRAAGQHFLGNVDLINKTRLLKVAKKMPKGSHLHIHLNACLPAQFLIRQARDIDAMYIRSTQPLTTAENIAASRISFMVMTPHEATHVKTADGAEKYVSLSNLWDPEYVSNTWMSYKEFQRRFKLRDENGETLRGTYGAEAWLEKKMQIGEEEAHGTHQTGRG
jgi:adenosine deaminase CECR1